VGNSSPPPQAPPTSPPQVRDYCYRNLPPCCCHCRYYHCCYYRSVRSGRNLASPVSEPQLPAATSQVLGYRLGVHGQLWDFPPEGMRLSPPPSGAIGFWRRRLRFFWALAEKARRRVYTVLDCELAGRGLHNIWQAIVCFRNRAPFSFGCAWPVVAWAAGVSAPGPEICNLAGWW
jgi:hypothetical protein